MLCTQYQDQHCFNHSFTIKFHQQQNKSEFSGAKICCEFNKSFLSFPSMSAIAPLSSSCALQLQCKMFVLIHHRHAVSSFQSNGLHTDVTSFNEAFGVIYVIHFCCYCSRNRTVILRTDSIHVENALGIFNVIERLVGCSKIVST